jgi:hypothetical protein
VIGEGIIWGVKMAAAVACAALPLYLIVLIVRRR